MRGLYAREREMMADLASGEVRRSSVAVGIGTLQALRLIESVGDLESLHIVPVSQRLGAVMTADEVMAAKVKWARKAGYSVLTQNVPVEFAPYNTVIRVSETGTEDHNRDYLAHIVD
jgi:hypothetical protein